MQIVRVKFTTKDVRTAVFAVLIEAFGGWRLFAFFGLLILLAYLCTAIRVFDPSIMASLTGGLWLGLGIWTVIFVILYWINIRIAIQKFEQLQTKDVIYEFDDNGCAVTSSAWTGRLPWSSMARLLRYPGIWLVQIKQLSSDREITESFKVALRESGSIESAQASGEGFPVFWMQPVPIRKFLILPQSGLTDDDTTLMQRQLRQTHTS